MPLLPAWDANDQPLDQVLAAVADARTTQPPRLETFAAWERDYDQQGGGVVAPSGEVYCLPSPEGVMLVIDPETATTRRISSPLLAGGNSYGGVLASNGKIYSGTSHTGRVIVVDPETDTISFIDDLPRDRYLGSVLGADGRIYSVPNKPGEVLVIDPGTNSASLLPDSRITGGYWGSVLTPYGSIIAIPWEASRVLAIDFGSRLPADWPLSRLFNRL